MQSFEFIARVNLSYIYRVSCIDSRREESSIDVRVGTKSWAANERRRGARFAGGRTGARDEAERERIRAGGCV